MKNYHPLYRLSDDELDALMGQALDEGDECAYEELEREQEERERDRPLYEEAPSQPPRPPLTIAERDHDRMADWLDALVQGIR